MKPKYSKLSEYKISQLKKAFLLNASARKTAETYNVNRNTVNRYFKIFRENISNNISKEQNKLTGEVEVDEMYYGKNKGSKRRNNKSKIILFGLKQRNGKVIIKKVENCKAESLISQIEKNIAKNTTIYSDSFKSYSKIDKKKYIHKKINHSKEFVNKKDNTIHTNTIENIWRQVRRYLKVYNGVKKNFNLFLDEVLFRINYSHYNNKSKFLNKGAII